MKAKNVIYLFISLSNVEFNTGQKSCQSNSQCQWCEYCLSESIEKTASFCHNPFDTLDQACKRKKLCDNYECKNQGTCVESSLLSYFRPSCKCTPNFYGTHCEHPVPVGTSGHHATGVQVTVVVNRNYSLDQRFFEVIVFASAESYGEEVYFFATSPLGLVGWFRKVSDSLCHATVYPYRICAKCPTYIRSTENCDGYATSMLFPFKLVQSQNTFSHNRNIVGYSTKINVKVFNKGVQTFEEDFPVVVDYDDFGFDTTYVPTVELLKCPRQYEDRVQVYKGSEIEIDAHVTRQLFGNPNGETNVAWSVYEVITNSSVRTQYDWQFPLMYQLEKGGLVFNFNASALNLDFGTYQIAVCVSNLLPNIYKVNFATCFLEVVKLPLIAKISGGSDRVISSDSRLFISASESYDPNRCDEGNQHLTFGWTFSPQLLNYDLKPTIEQVIPNSALIAGTKYKITLRVDAHKMLSAVAKQTVLVSKKNKNDFSISILCRMNCLEFVRNFDPLLLEVISNEKATTNETFIWTYTVDNGVALSADDIRDPNYPSNLLCIEENVLTEGKTYTFMAESRIRRTKTGTTLQVIKKIEKGVCTVSPSKGRVRETLFSIICSKFSGMSTLIYEFYDTFPQDEEVRLSGRLIDLNAVGTLEEVWLTRGVVRVLVYDRFGGMIAVDTEEKITLEPSLNPGAELNNILRMIDRMVSTGQSIFKVASIAPDLFDSMTNKQIVRRFLATVGSVCSKSKTSWKRCLSLLSNSVVSLTKQNFKFDQISANEMIKAVYKVAVSFDNLVESKLTIPYITRSSMRITAISIITVLETIVVNRDIPQNSSDEIPFDFSDELKLSFFVQQIFNRVSKSMLHRQGKGYNTTTISSQTSLTVISSHSDDPKNILMKKELIVYEEVSVLKVKLKYDPFIVRKIPTSTSLVGLSVFGRSSHYYGLKPIELFREPIDIVLDDVKVESKRFGMSVKQRDSTLLTMDELDKEVQVIRVDVTPRSKVFLNIHLQNSEGSLRVFADHDIRPDYEVMRNKSKKITSKDKHFEVPYVAMDEDDFVYIGILPDVDTPIGKSVRFEIEMHSILCLNWLGHRWIETFCSVGPQTNDTAIYCSCSHLSFFSALFTIPPNEINPFNGVELLMNVQQNMIVVALVSVFLALFLLIIIWAGVKDVKDKARKDVLVLEDNFPSDEHCYLVAVYTGWRWFAGTSANVGVIIVGSLGCSRAHILKSRLRATLQSRSEDWFLIRCHTHLGIIRQIHIWHDNSGPFPDWFCDRIFVYDLHDRVAYTFYIEDWLSVAVDDFPEAMVFTATKNQINNVKRLLFENLFYSVRQTHSLANILIHHPMSNISRVDKVVTLLSFLLVKMLLSIAFFKMADYNVDIDDPYYSFGTREVIVVFEVLVISTVVLLLITVSFNNGYKITPSSGIKPTIYARRESELGHPAHYDDSEVVIMPDQNAKEKHELNIYQIFVHMMRKSLKPLPLLPVTMSRRVTVRKKNKKWYILAWAQVLFICGIFPYFIILYGLKFGEQKSKKWASCLVGSIIQYFLINSPVRLIILSVVLATNLERWVQMPRYNIDTKQLMKVGSPEDVSFYSHLIEKRTNPMYRPLSGSVSKQWRIKATKRRRLHSYFDLFIVVVYIVFVCLACSQYWIQERSRAVEHIRKTVLGRTVLQQGHLVSSNEVSTSLIGDLLVGTIYRENWYNTKPISSPNPEYDRMKYWVSDCTTKLIGPPILRQIRLRRGACRVNEMFERRRVSCIPLWREEVENKDDYVFKWGAASWEDTSGPYTPWKYLEPKLSRYPGIRGETGVAYPGGGYVAELSTVKEETLITLVDLLQGDWIDSHTRMVFVTFSLYNVNLHMFFQFILGVEHFPYKARAVSEEVTSVKSDEQNVWSFSYVVYCVITLLFIWKAVAAINRHGFREYICKARNITQLIVISLGVSSIALFIAHLFLSRAYIASLHSQGFGDFFDFRSISRCFGIAFSLLAVLFCFLMCLAVTLLPFGRRLLSVYYMTAFHSLPFVVVFVIVVVIFVYVSVHLVGSVLNIFMAHRELIFWSWSNNSFKLGIIPAFSIVFILICLKMFEKGVLLAFSAEIRKARLSVKKDWQDYI